MAIREALLVALVLSATTAGGEDLRALELVWMDHHGLFPDSVGAREEAEAILGDLGLGVTWEVGTDPRPATPGRKRIQVVLMPSEPSSWGLSTKAMGVVLLPDRSPQKTVYVFYRPILRNLGLGGKTGTMLRPGERRDLSRALGRVVAHEVIHALAPGLSHADEGLMHDALLSSALSKGKLSVDQRTRDAFLLGLAREEKAPAVVAAGSYERER